MQPFSAHSSILVKCSFLEMPPTLTPPGGSTLPGVISKSPWFWYIFRVLGTGSWETTACLVRTLLEPPPPSSHPSIFRKLDEWCFCGLEEKRLPILLLPVIIMPLVLCVFNILSETCLIELITNA